MNQKISKKPLVGGKKMIIDEPNFKSVGEFIGAIIVIFGIIFLSIWLIGGLFSSPPIKEIPDSYWHELDR